MFLSKLGHHGGYVKIIEKCCSQVFASRIKKNGKQEILQKRFVHESLAIKRLVFEFYDRYKIINPYSKEKIRQQVFVMSGGTLKYISTSTNTLNPKIHGYLGSTYFMMLITAQKQSVKT